jgi:hypothetical protein
MFIEIRGLNAKESFLKVHGSSCLSTPLPKFEKKKIGMSKQKQQ